MLQFFHRNMAQCVAVAWIFLWQGNTVLSFDARTTTTTTTTIATFSRTPNAVRFQNQYRDNDLIRSNASSLRLLQNDNDDDENDENDSTNNNNNGNQRRIVIGSLLSVPLSLLIPSEASSRAAAAAAKNNDEVATKKPFAPLENLLPAIRVKLSIDSAIDLTRALVVASERAPRTTNLENDNNTLLSQLKDLLLKQPQNKNIYVQSNLALQGVPSKPADLYLKPYQSTKGDLPFQKALIRSGDVDAWKRLKRREKTLEQSNAIREALNAYTDALSFSGDSYLLRVDTQTKSSMVREDRLPDIKQVITSDMGMRYLYRNQVLTAMDDVKAELEYQLKLKEQQHEQQQQQAKEGSSSSLDDEWRDLLDLLVLASEAMDRWLSLVPSEDVKEALKTVASEEQRHKQ